MAIINNNKIIITDQGEFQNSPALTVVGVGADEAAVTVASYPPAQGTLAGFMSGGNYDPTPSVPAFYNQIITIDKFPFAVSNANATDVGDLSVAREDVMGYSSSTDGFTGGGVRDPASGGVPLSRTLMKWPFAISGGTATDVGYLGPLPNAGTRRDAAAQSSNSDGFTSGGWIVPGNTRTTLIDKFPFSITTGTASSVGNLTTAVDNSAGHSNDGYAFVSGGIAGPGPVSTIEKFPFNLSSGTSTDVGDLSSAHGFHFGHNSSTDGFTAGGSPPDITSIDKFPFNISAGVSVQVGNLSVGKTGNAPVSSISDGFTCGGYVPSSGARTNQIEKFPFSIFGGTAADLGDLSENKTDGGGHQD